MTTINKVNKSYSVEDGINLCRQSLNTSLNVARGVNESLSIFDSLGKIFSFIPKISENFLLSGKNVGRSINGLFIPFRIQGIFTRCVDTIKSNSVAKYIDTAFNVFIDGVFLADSVLASFQLMKHLKWIQHAPMLPFFDYVFLPTFAILTGMTSWDLIKITKTFSLIKSGSAITTKKTALEELTKLRSRGLAEIEEQLGLSPQCKLAERVDSLMKGLKNKGPTSLKKVQEFYDTMKSRTSVKLSFCAARLAAFTTYLAGEILLLAVPYIPLIGAVTSSVAGVGYSCLAIGEEFFIKDDIFDKKAQCLAGRIKDMVIEGVKNTGRKMYALAHQLIPCTSN